MRCVIILLVCAAALCAEERLPQLAEIKYDSVVLKNETNPIVGTIVGQPEADGSVRIEGINGGKQRIPGDSIERIEFHQTAAECVKKRGEMQLKAGANALDTLKWGIDKKVYPETVDLAAAIMQKFPGDIAAGEIALQVFKDQQKPDLVIPAAKALITEKPMMAFAYEALAQVYIDQKKDAELAELLKQWLNRLPTSNMANQLLASQAEKQGNLAQAQEAFRKGFELHRQWPAAVNYARLSMIRGDYAAARDAALKVIASTDAEAKAGADEAHALAGSALLALGDHQGALTHLQAAAGAKLAGEVAEFTKYNLGLAYWHAGNAASARQAWSELETPEGELALAIVDHKGFPDEDRLLQPQLKAVAQELNACLYLESQRYQQARAVLNTKSNKRHQFLNDVAEVLKNSGSDASLRVLAATPGVESLRWQAYGLLLARKFKEAEALLDKLPADDGYGAVYRVYAAAGQHDDARAKELFTQVASSSQPPKDYVAKLSAEYNIANDEIHVENFDWVEGDQLGSGWQPSAPGTNIRVHAADGKLNFEGTQSTSVDPVTSAWMMFPSDRLRAVQANLDIGGIGNATVGLEILDEARKEGFAYAIGKDNRMNWRMMEKGTWGAWEQLNLQMIQSVQPVLRLEFAVGRLSAVAVDDLTKRYALGTKSMPLGGSLCIGVFGAADVGTQWKLSIDQFRVEQKSSRK